MTRPGSDRDAYEYSGEEDGVTGCAGGDRHYLTQNLKPQHLRQTPQGSVPGHAAGRPALPESFVQGDALGLVLTEVQLRHTVVDHLITQLPWRSWGREIRCLGGIWGSPKPQSRP